MEQRRDRAAREVSLIVASAKLFASRGFEATKTREIAIEAGCSEGLIHRYFGGKDGLLLAIVRHWVAREADEFKHDTWRAPTIEDELIQLVEWELERAWREREFLKVVLRQAIVDPIFSKAINSMVLNKKRELIEERLSRFRECQDLPKAELEALAHFIITTGFMFGFIRPVVLRQDRAQAAATANHIARMLGRSLASSSFSLETFETLPSLT